MEYVIESKIFLFEIYNTYLRYFRYGPRSPEKVNYFHKFLKRYIESLVSDDCIVELEYEVESLNSRG